MPKVLKSLILKESFEGGLKHSLYSNFRKWSDAFLELADNAVSNRIPKKKLIISILTTPRTLTITNYGGLGMGVDELRAFLQWGKIKPRSPYDLGAYSQGGKSAMGYLGTSMKIKASPMGKNVYYLMEDDNLHNYELKSYSVIKMKTDDRNGYVEVQVQGLRRSINENELKALMATVYRPLFESGGVEIKHNGSAVRIENFPLDEDFKIQKFYFPVKKGNEYHQQVRGWIGRLTTRSGIKGGMRCYKLGRLISDKEFFGQPDAHYKQSLNFLFGEVHLDHIPATTNKTDFDRDSGEWKEVEQQLFTILQPHIDELLGRELEEPTDEEKERVKKAKEIFNELMKLMKKKLEGAGTINLLSEGQKPKEEREVKLEYIPPSSSRRKQIPRTPPPKDSVGKRRRLKEFMDWTIRPMDETVRSKIEDNGGRKLLVINNIFPGFKAARGHLLYLIETAVLQLSKPDIDEKLTIDEYLEDFDEMYAFCCSNFSSVKESLEKKKNKSYYPVA
ncbi:MAG: hypothetical protein HYT40_02345 [Candidatus Sungbacteria bacterium]|uniref:Uncharacterized protein n=1 Tax=Candidatus Sungiibacteriota bacterium TaxID=2750080 RepID=A0A931WP54_9BACT|nr:hypothetical protein [Candidatus Sungbacteria bacterium]